MKRLVVAVAIVIVLSAGSALSGFTFTPSDSGSAVIEASLGSSGGYDSKGHDGLCPFEKF